MFKIELLDSQPHEFFRQIWLAAVYKYCAIDVMSGCWNGCLQLVSPHTNQQHWHL